MRPHLEGVIPPSVTPFTASEELDEEGLRREIEYLLHAGVHGVTVTGSTGEGHTLSIEESCRAARVAVDAVNGRVPVVSGIIRDSTRDVVEYGLALKEEGVDALQITPVHYLYQEGEDGTLVYFDEIGQAVQLPIVIYNVIPWHPITPPALIRLAELEWIIAVKQSNGDFDKLADLLRAVHETGSDLRVLSAIDQLLFASYVMGAHGSVAAILTAVPYQSVALWNAVKEGQLERGLELHEKILPLWRLLDAPDGNSRMKAVLEMQGRQVGPARRPQRPVSTEVQEELRQALERTGEPIGVTL